MKEPDTFWLGEGREREMTLPLFFSLSFEIYLLMRLGVCPSCISVYHMHAVLIEAERQHQLQPVWGRFLCPGKPTQVL